MRGEKGVTLTTLTIYIIVSAILLGTLAFVNINFMSELGELTRKSKLTNEISKFYSYFVEDLKNAKGVLEFSNDSIRFDNGAQYIVKYRSNEKIEDNQTYDVYEVYRGNTLITDELSGIFFDYDNSEGYIKVRLYAVDDNIIHEDEQYFKVGRGY